MSIPLVEVVSISKRKISNKAGMNQSIVRVKFDQNVIKYVAMLNGVDYLTGTNVHSGGAVTVGSMADIIIDWNELDVEGENTINIYGQATDGTWTGQVIIISSTYGRSKYGKIKYGQRQGG